METKYIELFQKILPKISVGDSAKGFGIEYDIRYFEVVENDIDLVIGVEYKLNVEKFGYKQPHMSNHILNKILYTEIKSITRLINLGNKRIVIKNGSNI